MRRDLLRPLVVALTAAATMTPGVAFAYSAGIIGYTGSDPLTTCKSCHAAAAGTPEPSAVLTGPATLMPGATGTYSLTVSGGPAQVGGVDVGTDNLSATLKALTANTQVTSGELRHTTPLPYSNNALTVSFQVTAPTASGTVTLFAAGLSANGSQGNVGDLCATAKLQIAVQAPVNTPPTIAQAPAAAMNPVQGTRTNLTVLGADDGGEAALRYTWSMRSGPAAVTFSANGNNAAKNVVATFTRAGAYTFEVAVADSANQITTSSLSLNVSAVLTTVSVSPQSGGVAVGKQQPFTAYGMDQFSAPLAVQPALSWTVTGGGTVSASGIFTAGASAGGPFTVTATSGAISGTAAVTVSVGTAPTVAQPSTAASNPVFAKSVSLSVLGADDSGEAALTYSWTAPGAPAPVTFSANGSNGARNTVATFAKAGSYRLLVSIRDAESLTVTSEVNVTVGQALDTLQIAPAQVALRPDANATFTTTALDPFGDPLSPQPAVGWHTTGGGTISPAGVFAAGPAAGGPFIITATVGESTATAQVTIAVPPQGRDKTAPSVAWVAPYSDTPLSGSVALEVLATDDVAVAGVTFVIDDQPVQTVSAAPWRVTLDTLGLSDGEHTFLAVVADGAGNQSQTPPIALVILNHEELAEAKGEFGCSAAGDVPGWALAMFVLLARAPRRARRNRE